MYVNVYEKEEKDQLLLKWELYFLPNINRKLDEIHTLYVEIHISGRILVDC